MVEEGVAGWGVDDGDRGEWLRGEGESLFAGDVWLQPGFLLGWGPVGSTSSGLAVERNHWDQGGMATSQCG